MKQSTDVNPAATSRVTAVTSVALLLLGLPLLTALVGLAKTSVNIPLTDDYDAITDFLYRYVHIHGFFARVGWVLTAQHNEHKLMLLNAVVALQYHLIGHANYRALQLLGDLSVPATLWLLWLLLARQQRPFHQAIWIILVPSYLFLSLCYYETVNWANTEIQELTFIPLAIACVLFFTSSSRRATLWGTLFLILSIASFVSGFFLAIALLILLTCQRRWGPLFAVAGTALGMAALYSVNYKTLPHQPLSHHLGGLVVYSLAFLGGILSTVPASTVLGAVLVAGFIFLLTRGWIRLSPDTFCIALLCLVTAAAVAPARYSEGVQTAMTSRYRMYPLILLSAEYLAVLRIFVPQRLQLWSIWTALLGLATCAAIAFGVSSQIQAYRNLHARQRLLTTHLILWERHPERLDLIPNEFGYLQGDRYIPFRIRAQTILAENIANGLYIPPVSAADPLPVKPHADSTLGIEDETWPPQATGDPTNPPARN